MIYVFKGLAQPRVLDKWDEQGLPGYCYILASNGWFRRNAGKLEKVYFESQVPNIYRTQALIMARTVKLIAS